MSIHLVRELNKIKKAILKMGTIVEETIDKATRSVIEHDTALAEEVMKADEVLDELEIEIEEECLKVLALHQPVAIDLRYIVSVMKINSDLERMGDLSYNIARRVKSLARMGRVDLQVNISEYSAMVKNMVHSSLEALVEHDAELARKVIADDDNIDEVKKRTTDWAEQAIAKDPSNTGAITRYVSFVRNLERIGDLATNIAEDVIYLVEGKIVRHQMGGD
jgi:phosphate transport system protein